MLQMFLDYRGDVQNILSYVVCFSAIIWGARPERLIGLCYLLIFKGSIALRHVLLDSNIVLTDTDWLSAGTDLTAAIAFLVIAVNANRNYPLSIAAFQLVSVAAHLAREMLEAMTPIAYAILVIGPTHFITIILAIGLIRHVRRRKRFGEYRDWRMPIRPDALPMSRAEGA